MSVPKINFEQKAARVSISVDTLFVLQTRIFEQVPFATSK